MMIRIEQLQQILELAKTHSMRKASENLFISQPAISTALVKLEEELGVKIFVRTNKGVYPTPDGQSVIDIAGDVFKELNKLYLLTHQPKENANFTKINIYCNSSLSTGILATILPKFHGYFPHLAINFIEGDFDQILKGVANDPHGLGLVYQCTDQNPLAMYKETLTSQKIGNAYPYLISRQNDYNFPGTLTLEEVGALPLVAYTHGSAVTDYILHYLVEYCSPNIILSAPNSMVYANYIESGLACGLGILLENRLIASTINPDLVHFTALEMDVSFELIQIQNKQCPPLLSQTFFRLLHEHAILATC